MVSNIETGAKAETIFDLIAALDLDRRGAAQHDDMKLAMGAGKAPHHRVAEIHGRHFVESALAARFSREQVAGNPVDGAALFVVREPCRQERRDDGDAGKEERKSREGCQTCPLQASNPTTAGTRHDLKTNYFSFLSGARGRNRTTDTRIFNPLLYP